MTSATRPFGTMVGLDHIGVGVRDMDVAMEFYARLGFSDVAFDYSGDLPGIERVTGHESTAARIVYLRSANPTPLGPGSVKLVQLTSRPVPEAPAGVAYGELGICEICVHAHDQAGLHRSLVAQGAVNLMDPVDAVLEPHSTRCSLSYVADPDDSKIELIEWLDLESGWPTQDGPQGVNHVAFGVTDIDQTREFYRALGFTGQLFSSDGYFEPMHPWFTDRPAPSLKMMLLTSPVGGHLEPVQQDVPGPDCRGQWGQRGTFEFAVGARNLDLAAAHLDSLGIELLTQPVTVEVGDGATYSYLYFVEPDGLNVLVSEVRA